MIKVCMLSYCDSQYVTNMYTDRKMHDIVKAVGKQRVTLELKSSPAQTPTYFQQILYG